MRYAELPDMIEFVLRQNGGPTRPAYILHRLHELELLDRRSGIEEGNILFTAKAEPERFVVEPNDSIRLTPAQFENLSIQFRKRIGQLMEALRGGLDEDIGLTAAVLIQALYMRDQGSSPELWTTGSFKDNCLKQTIDRLALSYPEPMKRVVFALEHVHHHLRPVVDQWLLFADLVKPEPAEAYPIVLELMRGRRGEAGFVPYEISWLMGQLINSHGRSGSLIDLHLDAGVLPAALDNRHDAIGKVVGRFTNPTANMIARMNADLRGVDLRTTPFSAPFFDPEDFDRVIAAPPWGRMRDPYDLTGLSQADASTIYAGVANSILTERGMAVILVPAGFLFKVEKRSRSLREEFLRDDRVEAVLQLPVGAFRPLSSVQAAIVILNRNKAPERRKQVLMVQVELEPAKPDALSLAVRQGLEDYKAWKNIPGRSHIAHVGAMKHDGYNLLPSRHIARATAMEMQHEDVDGIMVHLAELVIADQFERVPSRFSERLNRMDDPPAFVRVRNLAKDPAFPYLQLEESEEIKGDVRIVDRDAVLVSRQFANPLPTIYQAEGGRIAIASNVLAIRPDTTRVQPEYLVHEMRQPYYLQQIKAISFGATIPAFNLDALLSTRIRLRPLAEQQKLIEERSDVKRLEERFERLDPQAEEALRWTMADLLRGYGLRMDQQLLDKLIQKVTDHVRLSAESRVKADLAANLGNLAHNFNNKHRVVAGNVRRIRTYLETKMKDGTPISAEDPVRKPLRGETVPPSLLGEVLDGLQQSLDNMTGLIEQEMNLLSEEAPAAAAVDVIAMIKKVVKGFRGQEGVHIHPRIVATPLVVAGNERRLEESLQNVIDNAIKHGRQPGQVLNIEIEVWELGVELVQVLVGNDGPASELAFDDMVKKGGRSSSRKGSGLGLYMTKRWIEEMGGHLFDAMDLRNSFRRPINFAVGIELKRIGE